MEYLQVGRIGKRRFTVITLQSGEVIQFGLEDLVRMQSEFPKAFRKLFEESN